MIYFDGLISYDQDPNFPPEETWEFETIAENLEEIPAEPGVNPYGESIQETSIDYESIANEAIDQYILSSLEAVYHTEEQHEETTLSIEEDWALDAPVTAVKAAPLAAPAAGSVTMPESKAYKLNLDGREVYAWFPDGQELSVSEDGYVYNATAANITGVIADSLTGIDLNSYNDTVTITPALTGSGNNNAYRYGSRVYVTDYSVAGNTLTNTVTYVNTSTLVKAPGAGYGFSKFELTLFGFGLLLIMLLVVRFVRK